MQLCKTVNIELTRLAGLFDQALINPSPLNLFTAVHSFVSAPGLVLAPFFSDIRHVLILPILQCQLLCAKFLKVKSVKR